MKKKKFGKRKTFKTLEINWLKKIFMVFYHYKQKKQSIGGKIMLKDKICKKREELNKSIEENKDYEEIYKISVELDELIAEYYRENEGQDA